MVICEPKGLADWLFEFPNICVNHDFFLMTFSVGSALRRSRAIRDDFQASTTRCGVWLNRKALDELLRILTRRTPYSAKCASKCVSLPIFHLACFSIRISSPNARPLEPIVSNYIAIESTFKRVEIWHNVILRLYLFLLWWVTDDNVFPYFALTAFLSSLLAHQAWNCSNGPTCYRHICYCHNCYCHTCYRQDFSQPYFHANNLEKENQIGSKIFVQPKRPWNESVYQTYLTKLRKMCFDWECKYSPCWVNTSHHINVSVFLLKHELT